jgi:hypothetical protein
MRRLAQMRLATCQSRKSACWTSGPELRRCERPCVCCTFSAWLSSPCAYVRTEPVGAIHDSSRVRFSDAHAWRSCTAIRGIPSASHSHLGGIEYIHLVSPVLLQHQLPHVTQHSFACFLFSRKLPVGWTRTRLGVHHTNLHKGAFDDRVVSLRIRHLHRDHPCPDLTCSCSTQIKSDRGRSRRTRQNLSMLSVPTHEEWLPHVLRLNSVMPCDWPTSDFLLGHNDAEISFDRSLRMPVTVFKDSSGRDLDLRERWLDLLQCWCASCSKRLVHVCMHPRLSTTSSASRAGDRRTFATPLPSKARLRIKSSLQRRSTFLPLFSPTKAASYKALKMTKCSMQEHPRSCPQAER